MKRIFGVRELPAIRQDLPLPQGGGLVESRLTEVRLEDEDSAFALFVAPNFSAQELEDAREILSKTIDLPIFAMNTDEALVDVFAVEEVFTRQQAILTETDEEDAEPETEEPGDLGRFTYSVTWSSQHKKYAGHCVEFPDLMFLADDRSAAFNGIQMMAEAAFVALPEGERPYAQARRGRIVRVIVKFFERANDWVCVLCGGGLEELTYEALMAADLDLVKCTQCHEPFKRPTRPQPRTDTEYIKSCHEKVDALHARVNALPGKIGSSPERIDGWRPPTVLNTLCGLDFYGTTPPSPLAMRLVEALLTCPDEELQRQIETIAQWQEIEGGGAWIDRRVGDLTEGESDE